MNKSVAEADQLAHPHHHLLLHIITLDHTVLLGSAGRLTPLNNQHFLHVL